ncbi:VgrG protein [Minicystis rosea]|nr:VgrG protein [Minicystis rosea]
MFDKTPLETMLEDRLPAGLGGRLYGVYSAIVTDVVDPDGQGRVKIRLPWAVDSGGAQFEAWARLATLMGGNKRGSFFIPDVDDEVLTAFEDGDPRRPFVLGGLWNGSDAPPETMDSAGKNDKKVLKSRNGVKVTLDDTQGQETLILETPGGQTVTLKDGPGSVEIKDQNGNSLKMEASGITITAAAKLTINAPEVAASSGKVGVDAGISKFSGVVQTDTFIATTVIATTYTPGAGNIL